jgi:dihydrolipoamide dehydrogenase
MIKIIRNKQHPKKGKMMDKYDIAIIGSGPGGYVAAIRAAQRGMKTLLIEKSEVGGICLNWGCIPTKAIIHSVNALRTVQGASALGIQVGDITTDIPRIIGRSRDISGRLSKGIDHLLKKNKITLIKGHARLQKDKTIRIETEGEEKEILIEAKNIIIASGSRPKQLPHIPVDGKNVISSRHALELEALPASMAIIGAGAIGVEFAYIFHHLGVEVSLIEAMDTLLPNEDADISAELLRQFKKQKINCFVKTKVREISQKKDTISLKLETPKGESAIEAERILSAVGVQGNTEDVGLEEAGIKTDKGFIIVSEDRETNVKGIYAIGDVAGNPCLAHKASKEAKIAIDHITGKKSTKQEKSPIPACTYCEPQVASVGLREKDAIEQDLDYEISKIPYRAVGKAVATDHIDGFLKCVIEKKTGKIVGAHCIGAEATELIAELTLVVALGIGITELAGVIHAHPTLSEIIPEVAEHALGEAVHV